MLPYKEYPHSFKTIHDIFQLGTGPTLFQGYKYYALRSYVTIVRKESRKESSFFLVTVH